MISDAVPVLHVTIEGGPSVTDWLTACATLATPVIALAALWPVWRQLRLLAAEKEHEQAARFAMWAQYEADEMLVLYANGSSLPVYNVRGTIIVGDGKRPTIFDRGVIGPTAEPVRDRAISRLVNGEILTSLRENFGDRVDRTNMYGDEDPPADVLIGRSELAKSVQVSVSFRDAAGIAWHRTADGRLRKQSRQKRFRRKSTASPVIRDFLLATSDETAPLSSTG